MSTLKAAFKKTVFSLVAILLGLAVALTIAEGILRLTNTTPYHRNALNAFHEPDPYLGWRGRPGFTGTFVREDFKAIIAMDDKGYRKKHAKTQPLPDAECVVFLGDSFAWGWGVSQGELFSDVLQDLVGPRYNVINLGMNTFGTVQEWIQLEREVLSMKPSRVGILFYANDFEDNLNGRGDSRPYCEVENGRVVLRNIPIAHPIGGNMRSIMRNSYALTHARYYHNIFREYVELAKKRIKRWIRENREMGALPIDRRRTGRTMTRKSPPWKRPSWSLSTPYPRSAACAERTRSSCSLSMCRRRTTSRPAERSTTTSISSGAPATGMGSS